MRIDLISNRNYIQYKSVPSFKSSTFTPAQVEDYNKTGKLALEKSNNLFEESIKIKTALQKEKKEIKEVIKNAAKDDYEDDYYENGNYKRRFWFSKTNRFSSNIRYIDYTSEEKPIKMVVIEDNNVKSITHFDTKQNKLDEYSFRRDGTVEKFVFGKENLNETTTKFDRVFTFDDRGFISCVEEDILSDDYTSTINRMYLFDKHLSLLSYSENLVHDKHRKETQMEKFYLFKDKKPKSLELNVSTFQNVKEHDYLRKIEFLN